jgi:hypothetical protein
VSVTAPSSDVASCGNSTHVTANGGYPLEHVEPILFGHCNDVLLIPLRDVRRVEHDGLASDTLVELGVLVGSAPAQKVV